MSWTSFKKGLRVGAKLRIENIRRPWRSRQVEIVSRSQRSIVVRDGKDMFMIHLPAAAFTHVRDDGSVELLAEEDGPAWNSNKSLRQRGIMAGEPFMVIELVEAAP